MKRLRIEPVVILSTWSIASGVVRLEGQAAETLRPRRRRPLAAAKAEIQRRAAQRREGAK